MSKLARTEGYKASSKSSMATNVLSSPNAEKHLADQFLNRRAIATSGADAGGDVLKCGAQPCKAVWDARPFPLADALAFNERFNPAKRKKPSGFRAFEDSR